MWKKNTSAATTRNTFLLEDLWNPWMPLSVSFQIIVDAGSMMGEVWSECELIFRSSQYSLTVKMSKKKLWLFELWLYLWQLWSAASSVNEKLCIKLCVAHQQRWSVVFGLRRYPLKVSRSVKHLINAKRRTLECKHKATEEEKEASSNPRRSVH